MKTINNYIQEKLVINKNSKLASITYEFKPKFFDESSYSKMIDGLKVDVPFTIIADNKKIKITKIVKNTTDSFDAWEFFDQNNKEAIGITSAGVYFMFITNEEIYNHLYDSYDRFSIKIDKKDCNIVVPKT